MGHSLYFAAAALACVSSALLLRSRDDQGVLAAEREGRVASRAGAGWPAESAPDGLTLVATIGEKTAQDQKGLAAPYLESLTGDPIGESNALVVLQKMERGDGLPAVDVAVKQSKSGVQTAQAHLQGGSEDYEVWATHHEEVARDLSAGTLLCSGAAFCHESTPVMTTFGAVVDAHNQAKKVVVDTIVAGLTAENPPKVIVKDLQALLTRDIKSKLDSTKIAWDAYTDGAHAWPNTARVADAAGSITPDMRDLDGLLLLIEQSINGLAHMAGRGMGHLDIKPPSAMKDTRARALAAVPAPPARAISYPPSSPPTLVPPSPLDIMLDGPHRTAKLIDFGTACIAADAGSAKANTLAGDAAAYNMRCPSNKVAGTAEYLSPNQYTGFSKTLHPVHAQVLHRADLFSLGLIMLQLLARGDATGHAVPIATDAKRVGDFRATDVPAFTVNQHMALARACRAAAAAAAAASPSPASTPTRTLRSPRSQASSPLTCPPAPTLTTSRARACCPSFASPPAARPRTCTTWSRSRRPARRTSSRAPPSPRWSPGSCRRPTMRPRTTSASRCSGGRRQTAAPSACSPARRATSMSTWSAARLLRSTRGTSSRRRRPRPRSRYPS